MDTDYHVLIVEDDATTRDAVTLVLESEGYLVNQAANGQEALDHLREDGRPRVILLDLMMPVKDGWQFRAEQREDPALSTIPVVVCSADGSVQQKAASLGAAGFLQKPLDYDELLRAVRPHF
jgi:CheY-like chemotaxis protein